MGALALGRRRHDRGEQRGVEQRHADGEGHRRQPDGGHRAPGGDQPDAGRDRGEGDRRAPPPAEAVGQPGADDADDEDEAGVEAEHAADALLAEVLGVEGHERRVGDERDEAEEEDDPRPHGVRLEDAPPGRVGDGPAPRDPDGGHRRQRRAPREHHPHGREAVLDQRLADRRADGQAAVEGDREVRRRLAPPVVGGQVLGRGGDADEHGGLAGPGHEPGQHEDPQLGGRGVEQDRHRHHRGAGDGEDPPAVAVAHAPDPGPQQRGGHRHRADADADRQAVAVQLALDEAGHGGHERADGDEVGERRQHHDRERRGQQALVALVERLRGDVVEHSGRQPATGRDLRTMWDRRGPRPVSDRRARASASRAAAG